MREISEILIGSLGQSVAVKSIAYVNYIDAVGKLLSGVQSYRLANNRRPGVLAINGFRE